MVGYGGLVRKPETAAVSELEKLIRSNRTTEEQLHRAVLRWPALLYRYGGPLIVSKPRIDTDFVADFGARTVGNGEHWCFIEIERATHRLFTKSGLPSQALNQALKQIRDWDQSLTSYMSRFNCNSFSYTVVIGRRNDLSSMEKRRLASLNATLLRTQVLTWDAFIDPLRKGLSRLDPDGPVAISDAEYRSRDW